MYRFAKIAGLCLASMLMMGMALAGNAAAEIPLWLLCLEGSNSHNTKYTENQCQKTPTGSEAAPWESVPIGTKSDTVRILALSLRLEDTKGELGAAVRVVCPHVMGIGLISGRNLLLVREAKVKEPKTECTATGTGIFKVCKEATRVEGTHLPWRVEVYKEEKGKFVSRIEPDEKGEPGWTVECANQVDECVSEGAGTLVEVSGENDLTEEGGKMSLLVFGEFLTPNTGNCSVGGAKAGKVEGFLAILLSTGLGLSLNL